jgi:hypothetical protein
MTQPPVRLGINERDRNPGKGKHTKFKQPEEDVKNNYGCTGGMKLALTFVLLALASATVDAVVDVLLANLVEQRVYEERASGDAEPQVIRHHRAKQRDIALTFLDDSKEPD